MNWKEKKIKKGETGAQTQLRNQNRPKQGYQNKAG